MPTIEELTDKPPRKERVKSNPNTNAKPDSKAQDTYNKVKSKSQEATSKAKNAFNTAKTWVKGNPIKSAIGATAVAGAAVYGATREKKAASIKAVARLGGQKAKKAYGKFMGLSGTEKALAGAGVIGVGATLYTADQMIQNHRFVKKMRKGE